MKFVLLLLLAFQDVAPLPVPPEVVKDTPWMGIVIVVQDFPFAFIPMPPMQRVFVVRNPNYKPAA